MVSQLSSLPNDVTYYWGQIRTGSQGLAKTLLPLPVWGGAIYRLQLHQQPLEEIQLTHCRPTVRDSTWILLHNFRQWITTACLIIGVSNLDECWNMKCMPFMKTLHLSNNMICTWCLKSRIYCLQGMVIHIFLQCLCVWNLQHSFFNNMDTSMALK